MLRKSGATRALDPCRRTEESWALGTRIIVAQIEEKPEPTSDTKTEKPLVSIRKTENQILKNEKSANRDEHQNRKTVAFWPKNRKTDPKNSQNRKTENPNAPLQN